MQLENIMDIPEFRQHLREMQKAFQEGMALEEDYPSEWNDLVAAMGRLDKELGDQRSQQVISDFLTVSSFFQSLEEEDGDEDDDEDLEFAEFDEDEEEF
jgi:hypothetical protein